MRTPLGDEVARIKTRDGRHTLYVDTDADADELAWAMGEALRAVVLGVAAAPSARQLPALRLVG